MIFTIVFQPRILTVEMFAAATFTGVYPSSRSMLESKMPRQVPFSIISGELLVTAVMAANQDEGSRR